jgi:ubiquinone/menaquinone biosynthesis C-methylase UbiE
MTLSASQWHQRYIQQAQWTHNLRKYVYDRLEIQHANKILDIGCGTGVLENELNRLTSTHVYGVDIELNPLHFARKYAPEALYTVGDCLQLPYRNGVFDITLCHFLLLWIKGTSNALMEMIRVTRPDGFILAMAEPDYGGRIDYPYELSQIGIWQINALKLQGANPMIGRELRSLFIHAGLSKIEVGVLGGQWVENEPSQDIKLEWEVIQSDLYQNNEFIRQADKLKALDATSRQAQRRILFVPTFYAFGKVQG